MTCGKRHAAETAARFDRAGRIEDLRRRIDSGEYPTDEILAETTGILTRILRRLDESQERLPYQGRDAIIQGPDERDAT